MTEKQAIKIAKHGGKEFTNSFRFIGQVKPVRKKEEDSDNWIDVPLYQETITRSGKPRRVIQFNVETAYRNELKVELAGMEKDFAYAYSRKHGKSHKVDWADRFNKEKLPDETYHLMTQEWDLAEEIAEWLEVGQWVDIRGKYEFSTFTNDEGKEMNSIKRVITNIYPLKNGEVIVKGLKEGDEIKVYPNEKARQHIGYGKADKDGVATIKVGLLKPEGGEIFICKVEGDKEGKRSPQKYNDSITETERITIKNNIESVIKIETNDGTKKDIIYIRDFNDENFIEVNTFNMQLGIKSTYQDEETKNTKVNGVFLSYGKEKSIPNDVELTVYYKESQKTPLADAFARLNRYDFMEVKGIDNNRSEYAWVNVEDSDDDENPFADVEEKTTRKEKVTTGTRKGLEILNYVNGSYMKELLTEEEFTKPEPTIKEEQQAQTKEENPFETISDDDLPF